MSQANHQEVLNATLSILADAWNCHVGEGIIRLMGEELYVLSSWVVQFLHTVFHAQVPGKSLRRNRKALQLHKAVAEQAAAAGQACAH